MNQSESPIVAEQLPSKLDGIDESLALPEELAALTTALPEIQEIYLFGSRLHRTGSIRSDIDLLLVAPNLAPTRPVSEAVRDIQPYFDAFIATEGVATSTANGSQIACPSRDALVAELQAVNVWTRTDGWVGDESYAEMAVLVGHRPIFTLFEGPRVARDEKIPIVFVTALPTEQAALVKRFDDVKASSGATELIQANKAVVRLRSGHELRVVACVNHRMGTLAAGLTTLRAIDLWSPDLVILVGITAGIKGEVSLGDLVVPDAIVEYEASKVTERADQSHGLVHSVSPNHREKVIGWPGNESWLAEWSVKRPGHDPGRKGVRRFFPTRSTTNQSEMAIAYGAMASGNKVVASEEHAAVIAARQRKTAAIEMEALGVAEACLRAIPSPTPYLVIKGVSDYADAHKNDDYQAFSMAASADYAVTLIREGVLP